MKKELILLLALLPLVYPLKVVVTVNTLAMIVRPIVGDVTVMLPPGMSPLIWKPSPQQVEEAINTDLFVNTMHWPFERQMAQRANALPAFVPLPPAEAVMANGFAVLRLPNGDLNPHGWWLYAPNAILLMHEVTAKACMKEPASCQRYLKALNEEVEKVKEVLKGCATDLKAVASIPGEQYPLASLGVEVTYVVASKGTSVITGYQLRKAIEEIKKADFVSVSDIDKNTPLGRTLISLAHRYHKPVVVVPLLDFNGDYAQYLSYLCRELPVGR